MSKIFDKNLIAARIRASWKQFEALGTGFAHKYNLDFFFRVETKILVLQAFFGVFILALIAAHISIVSARAYDLLGIDIAIDIAIVIGVTILGFLTMRMALTPSRSVFQAQKQFISSVAHELRTPLSIIRMNTEVALLEPNIDVHFRNMLSSNLEEIDRTSHIINNVLLMSTFLGPEKMEFADVDMGKTVDRALQGLVPLAEYRGIRITVKKGGHCIVLGNDVALSHVVQNIVGNAIAFTPFGGRIKISIGSEHRGVVDFKVEDTGVGIDRKDLKSILEPFYRAESSRNRAFGGSGLGLAIVNEVVRLHGGKISIRSTVGKGTTVTVSFISSGINDAEQTYFKPVMGGNGVAATLSSAYVRG